MTERERIERRMNDIKGLTDKHGIGITHVEFVPGGKTNESYIVYGTDGLKYLARIAGIGTENFVDREKEMHNVAVADRLGVAPKLCCIDQSNLLLEYIEGTCTTSQDIIYFLTMSIRSPNSCASCTARQRYSKGNLALSMTLKFTKKISCLPDILYQWNCESMKRNCTGWQSGWMNVSVMMSVLFTLTL